MLFIFSTPGACTIKNCGFVIYGFSSKLVCLSKPVEETNNRKGTSLLRNRSIFRKLQFVVFIVHAPVLIRHLRQLKTVVFLHWCLICGFLLICCCYICLISSCVLLMYLLRCCYILRIFSLCTSYEPLTYFL
jgi:hypothetical protein